MNVNNNNELLFVNLFDNRSEYINKTWNGSSYKTAHVYISSYESVIKNYRNLVFKQHALKMINFENGGVFEIKNSVIKPNGIIFISNNKVILQTVHDLPSSSLNKLTIKHMQGNEEIKGNAILLTKYGYKNYGHWLIEILPKIKFIEQAGYDLRELTFIVGDTKSKMDEVVLSSLHLYLGFKPNLIKISDEIKVQNLIYCTPITKHPFKMHPDISIFYKQFLQVAQVNNDNPTKKLFINRKSAKNRKISNDVEIENFFINNNFEIIDPADFSFFEQIKLFASAKIIVGIAGAGMTNTIFTNQASKIVYLVPPSMPNLFFYQLASIFQQDYYEYRGLSINKEENMFSSLFRIDLVELKKFLKNIIKG